MVVGLLYLIIKSGLERACAPPKPNQGVRQLVAAVAPLCSIEPGVAVAIADLFCCALDIELNAIQQFALINSCSFDIVNHVTPHFQALEVALF